MSSSGSEFWEEEYVQKRNKNIHFKKNTNSNRKFKANYDKMSSDELSGAELSFQPDAEFAEGPEMQHDFYENEETTAAVDQTVDKNDHQNSKKDYDEISNVSKSPSDDRSDYELESNKEESNNSKNNKESKEKEEKKATPKLGFDEVIMKEFADSSNDQNVVWCICQEGECSDDNEIIFCSTCWIPIHQFCYGSEIQDWIPEGEWNWQRCQYWLDQKIHATKIKCAYCVNLKGAMKMISYNKWAHIVWVNWIPEIWFKDDK